MLNVIVLHTSFIPYSYCTDLSSVIYLPILVNIINVLWNITCLFIYLLFRVRIYIINKFTLPILVRISIITVLMCIKPYKIIIWLTNIITVILLCN